jgi:murein DD-endopeptidase MepM/ murein hydrolase activator NlpD
MMSPTGTPRPSRSRLSRLLSGGRSYTLLLLEDERSRFRKLRVSRNFVFAVSALVGTVGLAGLHVPQLLLETRARSAEVTRLEEENARLVAERERFETALLEVSGQLDAFEVQAREIAHELGVDPLPPSSGGPSSDGAGVNWFEEDLDALARRTEQLDDSFHGIDAAYRERKRLLDATPSIMPVHGRFSHGFGWRADPITGEREFHQGIDIVAPTGSVVRASADGIVASTGRNAGYGKTVDVSHGLGWSTRYGHLSEISVLPGQRVRRGDILGGVGSTGRSTGPHLHYEIFRDGKRVDPTPYLGIP